MVATQGAAAAEDGAGGLRGVRKRVARNAMRKVFFLFFPRHPVRMSGTQTLGLVFYWVWSPY